MKLSFQSKLERIAEGINYFAVSVPLKITKALGTRAAVPIKAKVNDSPIFRGSLFPVGEGRHYMRIKAEIRETAKVKEGDKVKVQIEVVDRTTEISIPKDLAKALKIRRGNGRIQISTQWQEKLFASPNRKGC
jgi:antitoxin component of MazEF toxin-antitoxin module